MRKILFSDKYGLTKAVLEGRKTMTRRIAGMHPDDDMDNGNMDVFDTPKYKTGEVVAVAQSYKEVYPLLDLDALRISNGALTESPGWSNKMFVRADLMPHQIRITNVRIERMQDISDEDCMKEGINLSSALGAYVVLLAGNHLWRAGNSPREAFANLIRCVSGRKAWEDNPWVFVYEFELVR